MDSPTATTEKDFLFVIDIRNEMLYKNQAELREFLKPLPDSIRIYAIIHAGMNTTKVYCITDSRSDYLMVSDLTASKTEIIGSGKRKNKWTGHN